MSDYSASDIEVLEGLEGIRRHPAMYVGGSDKMALHHCANEIINNSVDEALAGHCKNITVTVHNNGSLSVRDDGRGIPVEKHPKKGISTATLVVTEIHAGGKFNNAKDGSAYKTSGGLHGVGASAVNALSETFILDIWRDGGHWQQTFHEGKPEGEMTKIADSDDRGTQVTFFPDRTIFVEPEDEESPKIEFDDAIFTLYLSSIAYLNPGLRINYSNEMTAFNQSWFSSAFGEVLDVISPSKSPLIMPILVVSGTVDTDKGPVDMDVALRLHNDRHDGVVRCYCNNIYNPGGGTHLAGFRSGLSRAVKAVGEEKNVFKASDDVTVDDIMEGFAVAVSVRIVRPAFANQTKDRLLNTECNKAVSQLVFEKVQEFFETNPAVGKKVAERALLSFKARMASEASRKAVERKGALSLGGLPGKLADCQSNDATECELYIVEGDSAGGSAKQGRDRRTQAILPLKGKPQNVQRAELAKALKSEEIQNIVQVLGCGVGDTFDSEKLRYHKIVLMTDADVDGAHITTLLLTMFHRLMPQVMENGHIYVAMPPLYRVSKGKGTPNWVANDAALEAFFAEKGGRHGWDVQRFKGLGEMNPEQLWETTMNPETRSLMRVNYQESESGPLFELLMGDVVEPRRAFIEDRAGYARTV